MSKFEPKEIPENEQIINYLEMLIHDSLNVLNRLEVMQKKLEAIEKKLTVRK